MIYREAILQVHAIQWAREAIAVPYKLLAFDRSKASGQWTHMREKARGVARATPDTLLIVDQPPLGHIWCEFKSPGNKPDADQMRMGAELVELGDEWFWTDSVGGYREYLLGLGLEMRPNAAFLALHHDGRIATEVALAEAKAGTAKKPAKLRSARPTLAQVRRGNAATARRLGL